MFPSWRTNTMNKYSNHTTVPINTINVNGKCRTSPSECFKRGWLREKIVANILEKMYLDNPAIPVYVLYNKYSLRDPKKGGGPRGDRFYVYREGITIVVRPKHKPLDIIIYKNGKRWAVWELTNYGKNKYMKPNRFQHYLKNLKNFECPNKFLVVNYPENLRKAIRYTTKDIPSLEKWNTKLAEIKLAKNNIFLIYWEEQDLPLEEPIEGWIEHE